MDKAQITVVRLRVWLREERVRSGQSQQDIADALSVKQTAVSRVESGTVQLTVEMLLRFADAIGVDPLDALRASTVSGIAPASCSAA